MLCSSECVCIAKRRTQPTYVFFFVSTWAVVFPYGCCCITKPDAPKDDVGKGALLMVQATNVPGTGKLFVRGKRLCSDQHVLGERRCPYAVTDLFLYQPMNTSP